MTVYIKHTLLILSFLFVSFGLRSQNADSLKAQFENSSLPDSIRVAAGLKLIQPLLAQSDTSIGEYVKTNLRLVSKVQSPLLKSKCLSNVGMYYLFTGDIKSSINYLTKAEKQIQVENKNHLFLCTIYSNLARLFSNNEQPDKSIDYYQQAIDVLEKQDTTYLDKEKRKEIITGYFRAYYSMGGCHINLKKFEASKTAYLTAEKFAKQLQSPLVFAALYSGLSDLSCRLKDYQASIDYGKQAIIYIEQSNSMGNLPFVYGSIANTYSEMGDHKNSIKYRLLALEIYKNNNNKVKIANAYLGISENYEALGDNTKALEYLRLHVDLDDSLRNADRLAEIDELAIKYETEKKEAAIKELSQKKTISDLQSQRKSVLIYSILGGIIAIALLSYFLFTRYKTKKQNELLKIQLQEAEKTIEAEKKATESELKALKSQMNPHFIFNALNSIQEQFMYGDKLKGNEQLGNFTYLTRQILTVSGKKQIPLSTEVEILTKYLELEKMRFQNDFEYSVSFSERIDEDYLQLPPMMIQPFVENSIKHGLLHKEGLKKLSISFDLSKNEDFIVCTIEDNGVGRQKSAEIKASNVNQHNSFSTTSIEQRLELLNSKLKLDNLIVYTDLASGTKVEIKIPLI